MRASAHSITLALVCWTVLGGKEDAEEWGWELVFLSSGHWKSPSTETPELAAVAPAVTEPEWLLGPSFSRFC